MKKSLIALAVMAASVAVFATQPAPVAVNVTGSATSGVAGSTYSYTNVNGVNQAAVHGSFAKAHNTTTVGANVNVEANNGSATTYAASVGGTATGAIGYNLTPGSNGFGALGAAGSAATQHGFGNITASADKTTGKTQYDLEAKSNAAVGTYSSANVVNSGAALSGSLAGAVNVTNVSVSAIGNTTVANGYTVGADGVLTFGVKVGSDETVDAGGALVLEGGAVVGSVQSGSFEAEVTKTFNASGTVTPPNGENPPEVTGGCVAHQGDGGNCGVGNGLGGGNGTPNEGLFKGKKED